MIDFSFHVNNPFSKRFKSLFFKHGNITKHKHWEFELHQTNTLIGMSVSWSIMKDHAGIDIELSFLTLSSQFQIYDIRHWNKLLNKWV